MSFFKTHKFNLLILILVSFFAYINVYNNEFISDDLATISTNKQIGNLFTNLRSFQIFDIIHSVDFLLGGLNPPIYHLTNILFHAGNVILVYILVGLLLSSFDPKTKTNHKWLSLASALLFATHPIHTEVVTWISGGPYAVYSFFLLLSFLFFINFLSQPIEKRGLKTALFVMSIITYLLSFLTSQKAIILPLLLAVFLISIKKLKTYFSPLILFFAIALPLTLLTLPKILTRASQSATYLLVESTTYNPLEQIPFAIGNYIRLLLWPRNLTFFHEFIMTQKEYTVMVIVTLTAIALTFLFYKRQRFLFFALSLFLISLLPTLTPFRIAWIIAERYVYLGSIGFTIILAFVIFKFGVYLKKPSLSNYLLVTILVFYSFLTLIRNQDWESSDTFWPATVRVSQNSSKAHNYMGDYYLKKGNLEKATQEFITAINIRGGKYSEAVHNLGNVYLNKNEATTAAVLFQKAINLKPNQKESYVQLASIYIFQEDYQKAKTFAKKAIEIDPNYSNGYNSLGYISLKIGDKGKALEYFNKALLLNPDNQNARINLLLLQ